MSTGAAIPLLPGFFKNKGPVSPVFLTGKPVKTWQTAAPSPLKAVRMGKSGTFHARSCLRKITEN
jgi:hypothetical protein